MKTPTRNKTKGAKQKQTSPSAHLEMQKMLLTESRFKPEQQHAQENSETAVLSPSQNESVKLCPPKSHSLLMRFGGGLTTVQLKKRGFHLTSMCPFVVGRKKS